MDAKTTSILLGHSSVSFTLDTYTHVLDSQKQEEMKVMEEFFTLPDMPQVQSYAIAVTPITNGFLLNPVDFEDMSIEANDLQYGIQCLQTTIAQKLGCVVLLHFSFLMFWGQIGVKINFSVKKQKNIVPKTTCFRHFSWLREPDLN